MRFVVENNSGENRPAADIKGVFTKELKAQLNLRKSAIGMNYAHRHLPNWAARLAPQDCSDRNNSTALSIPFLESVGYFT
jgi:hypothetical protein